MDVIPRIWCFFFAFYPSSRGCKGQRRLNEIKQGGRHTNIAVSQICISGELYLKILVIMIYCFGQYKLMSFEDQWEVVVFDWTSLAKMNWKGKEVVPGFRDILFSSWILKQCILSFLFHSAMRYGWVWVCVLSGGWVGGGFQSHFLW